MWDALLVLALAPQLALIAWGDLKGWRISNKANLLLGATYFAFAAILAAPWTIAAHAAFAAAMFLIMLFAFSRGWMGGGDVKFLTASFLWVGPDCGLVYSLALLPPMLVYVVLARLGAAPSKREGGRQHVPFGPIGAAGLAITLVACRPF
jgi:prepilin peptidase CpaA